MTFHRGAALPTSTSLGYADSSDCGPTAGNGFYRRWPDDLALLQEIGLTDVRLTLDWARLQPKPGGLDRDWVERFEDMVQAAQAIGVRTWVTLHDGSIPRWFDNEGGLDDAEAFATWWPRWVERAAETFGDHVHGWVPFAMVPDGAEQAWRDTWGILRGSQPVVAALGDLDGIGRIQSFLGQMDVVGVTLTTSPGDAGSDGDDGRAGDDTGDDAAGASHDSADVAVDRDLDETADRWGTLLRAAADVDDRLDLCATIITDGIDDPEEHAAAIERAVAVIDDAIRDGVGLTTAFVEPAIAGPESPRGLLDADRSPTPAVAAYLTA